MPAFLTGRTTRRTQGPTLGPSRSWRSSSALKPTSTPWRPEELTSDSVLGHLRAGLVALGYEVEASKLRADRVRRPVLFGPRGTERVAYEVDAVHDELGIVLEIEAGRGAQSNAVYRDLVRASLIVEARFFAIGVMRGATASRAVAVRSRSTATATPATNWTRSTLQALARPTVRRRPAVRLLMDVDRKRTWRLPRVAMAPENFAQHGPPLSP